MNDRCCDKQSRTDLAVFGALVAAPALLGLNRGIRAITTALAVGKLATSMMSRHQQSRQYEEFSQPARRQGGKKERREAAPAPQARHRTPSKGGLDHIEGAGSGPMEGAPGISIVR